MLCSRFLLVIYFVCSSMYTSVPIFRFMSSPYALVTISLFSALMTLLLFYNEVYLYLLFFLDSTLYNIIYFCVWLHSVWQSPSMLLQHGIILFFFMAEEYSIVYMYHAFFIHSSLDGHLGCLSQVSFCMLTGQLCFSWIICSSIRLIFLMIYFFFLLVLGWY